MRQDSAIKLRKACLLHWKLRRGIARRRSCCWRSNTRNRRIRPKRTDGSGEMQDRHWWNKSLKPQVPPLRYAPVGMTKGGAVTFIRSCEIGWTEKKQQVPPLRFAPVGMTILLQGMAEKQSMAGTFIGPSDRMDRKET